MSDLVNLVMVLLGLISVRSKQVFGFDYSKMNMFGSVIYVQDMMFDKMVFDLALLLMKLANQS